MAKQYKAGQIVTIGGKLYRLKNVKKETLSSPCYDCAYGPLLYAEEPCISCAIKLCIPNHLCLMRILPKSSLG